jgi:Arc/MetJ-type ribon-helix-helix transcriptional regulator
VKKATSYRLTEHALELIERLNEKLGLSSQTAVVELAIRKLAESEGVKLETKKSTK